MTSDPASAKEVSAPDPAPRPFQFGLRGLFAAMTAVAGGAFLFSLFGRAALPALIGAAVAILIHVFTRTIRDHERRQVVALAGYTLTAWLVASVLLKHLSQTDRVIAAGSIPAAIVIVWLICRRLTASELPS